MVVYSVVLSVVGRGVVVVSIIGVFEDSVVFSIVGFVVYSVVVFMYCVVI